eukprot:symbB.v1.2.006845.t1/scaffold408.1/size210514/3
MLEIIRLLSWLNDVKLQRYEATLDVNGFQFQLVLKEIRGDQGWLKVMPWRLRELSLDDPGLMTHRIAAVLQKLEGSRVTWESRQVKLQQTWTQAPKPLTEAELVDLMDKHGIGTDASIPQHIQTIQDRHYVQLTDGDGQAILPSRWLPGKAAPKRAPGRFLVATPRGVALVKGLSTCDASLCEPEVRALIERECGMVATAEMKQAEVLQRNVTLFRDKFQHAASALGEVSKSGSAFAARLRAMAGFGVFKKDEPGEEGKASEPPVEPTDAAGSDVKEPPKATAEPKAAAAPASEAPPPGPEEPREY